MSDIVGVRFKTAGKVYYFDPASIELAVNDQVVVETAQGLELGQVAVITKSTTIGIVRGTGTGQAANSPEQAMGNIQTAPTEADQATTAIEMATDSGVEAAPIVPEQEPDGEAQTTLKPVLRKATSEDIQRRQELEMKEKDALEECAKLVDKLKLPMKLLSAEYSLDGQRLTLNFSSVDRVDFRELVRDLARRLRVRVEMRQTGPRDEARMVGGCGRCGRPLCCATFLTDFAPVAMKMAKEQGLPLNPMKISGVCGRLMCCLGYENDQYRAMRATLPRNGQFVSTAQGTAKVVGSNPLKQTVQVQLESFATIDLPVGEVTVVPRPENRVENRPENKPLEKPRRENQSGNQPRPIGPQERLRRENRSSGGQSPQNKPQERPGRQNLPSGQPANTRPPESHPKQNLPGSQPADSRPTETPRNENQVIGQPADTRPADNLENESQPGGQATETRPPESPRNENLSGD